MVFGGGVLSLSLAALSASGQGVEPLLGKITDFGVYPIVPVTRSTHNYAEFGAGVEFGFTIGEFTRPMAPPKRTAICDTLENVAKKAVKPQIKTELCNAAKDAIVTTTLKELRRRPDAMVTDSTYSVESKDLEERLLLFEVAVASQQTPLRHDDRVDNWRLSGQIVEFPSVSVYTTIMPDWTISPYVGLRYVVGDLKGVKIEQGDSTATVEGNAVGLGGALGAVWEIVGFDLFGEFSYSSLHFDTARWKLPGNLTAQPASYPKKIDLHGLRFSIGVQIPLGGEK